MKCEHSEHNNKNETDGPQLICNENEVDANLKYEQENMEFKDLEGCFNDEHNKLFENSNTNVSIIPKDQLARFICLFVCFVLNDASTLVGH